MATVTINGTDYDVYADQAFAEAYLAGDVARWPVWDALESDDQKRALVSATRLLQRQVWRAGSPPSTDDPVLDVVAQAAALLAPDISAKPSLGDSGATGSNVKSVGAGSARVEFFGPTTASSTPLPTAAFDLLRGLLGTDPALAGAALDNVAYGSSNCQHSRFDRSDYGMIGDGHNQVDPDERLY